MNAALLRRRDPQRGCGGGGLGYDGGTEVVRWGRGKKGCLGNHIAEPVPERYRFTFATMPALLMKAEPWGDGRGGRPRVGGGLHTCRVLLEMKEAFELRDVDTTAQPYHSKSQLHEDALTY